MTRLSFDEAAEFVEIMMDCSVDLLQSGLIEAYVLDRSVAEVQLALDAFVHGLGIELDPGSVEITPDHLDDGDIAVARVVIKTRINGDFGRTA